MPIPTYNEKAGEEFTATFEDVDGAPSLPQTVHWRLVNDTHDSVVQDWTAVTASSVVSIDLPGSLMVRLDPSNARERFTLLVVADKDAANEYNEPYEFDVRRVGRV